MSTYEADYQLSIADPTQFWGKVAQEKINWFTPPKEILSKDERGFYRWFKGGTLNTAYLCLEEHINAGRGAQPAIYYDSPVSGNKETVTYLELKRRVAKFAGGLRNLGVRKGERVVLYMPMVVEVVVAMLAVARLGAIHSVVFGGFAPPELALRLDDAKPKALITASCGLEFDKVIPYKPLVEKALALSSHPVEVVVVKQRPQCEAKMQAPRDHDFDAVLAGGAEVEAVPVEATDPLYLLYTSGTTGKPKGIVRENGGHAVAMKYSMEKLYDTQAGETYWAGSDVGWVVGHSYIVYGPLLQGCATVLYEGKPVRTPDASSFWRVISEYRVKTFFTAPTAFRAVKKEDPQAELKKHYDLSCLRYVFLAGERLDPPTYDWLKEHLKVPVLDHWWQTETGWGIVANPAGYGLLPVKAGSATKPVPGYKVEVLLDNGAPAKPNETGKIAIRLPLPPGCLPTLWNNDARFRAGYLHFKEGYYLSGDGGYVDEEGYVFIMGRIDDVINVSGHRFSTGEMEELIGSHAAVAECAVVGITDPLRGQLPLGLTVLKDGYALAEAQLEKELCELLREQIGAVACFRQNVLVKRLPKTRSGKILRKTLRQLADEEAVAVPSTIDDVKIIDEIRQRFQERKIGRFG